MRVRAVAITGAVALLAALASAPAASAVTPTPVTCAGLPAAIDAATAGEVLQLPPGVCQTNVSVATNTSAFTLEGATSGGTTTLEPTNTAATVRRPRPRSRR